MVVILAQRGEVPPMRRQDGASMLSVAGLVLRWSVSCTSATVVVTRNIHREYLCGRVSELSCSCYWFFQLSQSMSAVHTTHASNEVAPVRVRVGHWPSGHEHACETSLWPDRKMNLARQLCTLMKRWISNFRALEVLFCHHSI